MYRSCAIRRLDSRRFGHGLNASLHYHFDRLISMERSTKDSQSARFERLVEKHKDAVYRQMVRVCSHREDAEDALATSIMLAFRAAEQLKDDQAFAAWLGTIGKRVCSRMRQHAGMQEALEFAESKSLIDHSVETMELRVLKGCVSEAVERLPIKYRKVYVACEIEGKTANEAANELGIGLAAAKSRLLRARAMVRETLDKSICST